MLKKTIKSAVISASIILGTVSNAFAEKVPDIYKLVPQDTFFTATVKTSKDSWKIFEENKSLKNQKIFQKITENLSKGKNKNMDKLVLESLGDNILFSFDTDEIKMKKIDPKTKKSEEDNVVGIIELKNDKTQQKLIDLIKKEGLGYKEFKYKNNKIFAALDKKDKNKTEFYYSFIDKYVLLSDKKELIEKSIKAYSKEIPSVFENKEISSYFDRVKEPYQVQAFLNMKKIMLALSKDKDINKTFNSLNMNEIAKANSLLINANLDSTAFTFLTLLSMEAGFDNQSDVKKLNFNKFASMLPQNTLLLSQYADAEKSIKKVKEAFDKIDSKDLKELNELEKNLREEAGIDLGKITESLTGDMAMAIFNTDEAPMIPTLSFIMNYKDKVKIEEGVKNLKVNIGAIMDEKQKGNRKNKDNMQDEPKKDIIMSFSGNEKYKDIEIFETNEIEDFKEFGLRPSYAFVKEKFILASHPSAIKAIIDRSENQAKDFTLEGNQVFMDANKKFNGEYIGTFFVNLKQVVNLVSPLVKAMDKDKTILNNLTKLESIASVSEQNKDNFDGKFALKADLKNMDFKWLFDLTEGNMKNVSNKAKDTSSKANAHSVQTMVETFGVDYAGFYPENVKILEKEAKASKYGAYWKELKNPFTNSTKDSIMDYKAYNKTNAKKLKGVTLYQPLNCSYNKTNKKNLCKSYKIYAVGENGAFLKLGKDSFLSNY